MTQIILGHGVQVFWHQLGTNKDSLSQRSVVGLVEAAG